MLKVEEQVIYKAFGLTLTSAIPFPELPQIDNSVDFDVEIRIEDLSKQWTDLEGRQYDFIIKNNLVLFKVPNIATFLIEGGNRIVVSPLKEYDVDVVRLYVLGSCMGALLLQRRIFPLHGSAIEINGRAYAIIGESGVGKSTLASAFLSRGYKLLTDDVIAITLTEEDNLPFVAPSYPQQKLWQESIDKFGIDNRRLRPIFQRETKFAIPIKNHFSPNPVPLAGVFELDFTGNEEIELKQIEGLNRFKTLFIHTYRNLLIQSLDLTDWHFINSTKIINQVSMYHLRRPKNKFTANELVSLIESCINKEYEQ